MAQEEVHLKGEIVDVGSYMTQGSAVGADAHARECAKKGKPVGLLTDDGHLYLLVDDHNNPDPYDAAKALGGKRADLTGKRFAKQGVACIVVEEVKGLIP